MWEGGRELAEGVLEPLTGHSFGPFGGECEQTNKAWMGSLGRNYLVEPRGVAALRCLVEV